MIHVDFNWYRNTQVNMCSVLVLDNYFIRQKWIRMHELSLHSCNTLGCERHVKRIIKSSSNNTKLSPWLVCFEINGRLSLVFKDGGALWQRMACDKASVDGSSAAIFTGTMRKTLWRIELVSSPDEASRSFISFWTRTRRSLFGFGQQWTI